MSNRFAYLIKVELEENNNKFYRMIEKGEVFTAEWGRIGIEKYQTKDFPISKWDSKLKEKNKNGYIEQTRLVAEKIEKIKLDIVYKEIEDIEIDKIVKRLQSMAKEAIKANYTISIDKVTQKMIEEAEYLLSQLYSISNIDSFNNVLLELFRTIPRKMKNVRDNLLYDIDKKNELIEKEENLLEVMKGQVAIKQIEEKQSINENTNKTILEVLELEIKRVNAFDIIEIKKALGELSHMYHNAWRVENKETQSRFDNYIKENKLKGKDLKLLWHGSRNENWWSILRTGLKLKPDAEINGKMFGNGTYFAKKSKKSLGYTSYHKAHWVRGSSKFALMALFNTAYGTPYDVYSFENKYKTFDYQKLKKEKEDANCLHAHAGKMLYNDEIVYYKEEQMTIKYLVELE